MEWLDIPICLTGLRLVVLEKYDMPYTLMQNEYMLPKLLHAL